MTAHTVPEIYLNTAQQERVCLLSDVNKILVNGIHKWKCHSSSLPDLNIINSKTEPNLPLLQGIDVGVEIDYKGPTPSEITLDTNIFAGKSFNLPSPAVSEKCSSWSGGFKKETGRSRKKISFQSRRPSDCSGTSNISLQSISRISTCATSKYNDESEFYVPREMLLWEFEDKISSMLRRTYSNPEICQYGEREFYIKSKDSLSCSDIQQQHKTNAFMETKDDNLLNPS